MGRELSDIEIILILFFVALCSIFFFSSAADNQDYTDTFPIRVYEYTNIEGNTILCKSFGNDKKILFECNDNMTYYLISGEVRQYEINNTEINW